MRSHLFSNPVARIEEEIRVKAARAMQLKREGRLDEFACMAAEIRRLLQLLDRVAANDNGRAGSGQPN